MRCPNCNSSNVSSDVAPPALVCEDCQHQWRRPAATCTECSTLLTDDDPDGDVCAACDRDYFAPYRGRHYNESQDFDRLRDEGLL